MEKLVSMEDRFPRKLADNFWVLGNYYFNLFLIKGSKKSILVEFGVSAMVDEVIEQLNFLRIKPDYLVLTHPHSDHLTGLVGLKESFPDATLITGEGAYSFIEHPKAQTNILHEDKFMSAALKAKGISPGRPPIKEIILPDQRIKIQEEQNIDLGDRSVICIPVAGHAPGSLVVFSPKHKAVIASDSLGFHFNGRCFLPLYFIDYNKYKKSLAKISSLEPAILGIGHQSPFLDDKADFSLSSAIKETDRLKERIINDNRSDEAIVEELFKENYRDEFTIYSPENIQTCFKLLVKRSK